MHSSSTVRPLELLFDLDGTLTDPFTGITGCLRHALVALGREPIDATDLRECIGPPLRESFRHLLESDDPHLIESAVAAYRERYFEIGLFENVLYDGIPATLATLAGEGHRLRIVTSKVVPAATRIVSHFGLGRYFSSVDGSALDGRFDDKSELLAHVIDANRIDRGRAVMIGDRRHDIIAARRNGVRCIGVTWGYGSTAELEQAGADALCDSPSRLIEAIAELPGSSAESGVE